MDNTKKQQSRNAFPGRPLTAAELGAVIGGGDTTTKEHSKLTVKFRPEETIRRDGDGKDIQGSAT